jgi:hypothetical protein
MPAAFGREALQYATPSTSSKRVLSKMKHLSFGERCASQKTPTSVNPKLGGRNAV